MVNGPEDVVPEWEAVDWRLHEDNVRRLRQRIFKAEQEQDLAAVRNQQPCAALAACLSCLR
jgi:RNA-directed DNA polymerase